MTTFYPPAGDVMGYDSPDLMTALRSVGAGGGGRKPRLYFTIGAQRSGKSTEARRWLNRQPNLICPTNEGVPRWVWDTDVLRLRLYGERYYEGGEPMAFAIKHYAIAHTLDMGIDACVAGTHSSKASVRRVLEIDRGAIPVLIDTPENVCKERAITTGQQDLLPVIERVCRQIESIKEMGVDAFVESVLADMDARVPY